MRQLRVAVAAWATCAIAHGAVARTITVGPHGDVARVAQAAQLARDGDTVVIAPGTYVGDVAVWPQHDLTVRARACCVRIVAAGQAAEGKAIFVVKGSGVTIENIAFEGARVADGNGAGIRHEGGRLSVRGCRFTGHQMGLMTSNDPAAELRVERSEFFGNHRLDEDDGTRPAHQLYVGRIARFELVESHVHDGSVGHLVKSRARMNVIAYNRIADGARGRASYEIEFPEGGEAVVIGNVVEQGRASANAVMLAYGAEGRSAGDHRLTLVHNTFIDRRGTRGPLLRVWPGPVLVRTVNNLLGADSAPAVAAAGFGADDFAAALRDVAGAASVEVRLRDGSPHAGRAVDLAGGAWPVPDREYVHPLASRPLDRPAGDPGALQRPRRARRGPGRPQVSRNLHLRRSPRPTVEQSVLDNLLRELPFDGK